MAGCLVAWLCSELLDWQMPRRFQLRAARMPFDLSTYTRRELPASQSILNLVQDEQERHGRSDNGSARTTCRTDGTRAGCSGISAHLLGPWHSSSCPFQTSRLILSLPSLSLMNIPSLVMLTLVAGLAAVWGYEDGGIALVLCSYCAPRWAFYNPVPR
jgi:hypothetical protein